MSGPMAASFGLEAAVLISARSIAQGAAEVATGLAAADKQAAMKRRQRSEERQRMRAAQQAGNDKQQRDAASQEVMRRMAHLLGDAATADAVPLTERMQALGEQGSLLQAQLAIFLERARATQAADTATARRVRVAQALERLELDAGEPLPAALEALAQQVIDAPGEPRADALVTELRLQVQRHNEVRAADAEQKQMQEAAALVLEASLQDLGYAVEEIEETLFGIYRLFAERFPAHRDMWSRMAEEEMGHAKWIRDLYGKVEQGSVRLGEDHFRVEGIQTFLDYANERLEEARTAKLPFLHALDMALDLESGLLEREFYRIFEADSETLEQALRPAVIGREPSCGNKTAHGAQCVGDHGEPGRYMGPARPVVHRSGAPRSPAPPHAP